MFDLCFLYFFKISSKLRQSYMFSFYLELQSV